MKTRLTFGVSVLVTVTSGIIIATGLWMGFVTLVDFFTNIFSVLVYAFLTALGTTILLIVTGQWKRKEGAEQTSPITQVEHKRREFNEEDVGPPIPIEGLASFLGMPNAEKILKDWLRKKLSDFCNVQVKSMDQSQDWSEVSGIVQDSNLLPYHFTLRLDSRGKTDKKKSYVK